MPLRRPFCLGVLLSAVLSLPALAQTGSIPWTTNLEAARAEARQTRRLVLIHFWTESCGPCKALETNVFSQPEVANALQAQFVPVKLNADDNPAIAGSMGVNRVPTDIVITPDGEMISKAISPATPMAYLSELSQINAKYASRSGQAYAAASAAAPQPGQFNTAYAGLQMTPSALPIMSSATSQPVAPANRYTTSVTMGPVPGTAAGPGFGASQPGAAMTQAYNPGQNGIPAVSPTAPNTAGGPQPPVAGPAMPYTPPQPAMVNNQFAQQPAMNAQQPAQNAQQLPYSAQQPAYNAQQLAVPPADPNANRYATAPGVPPTYLNSTAVTATAPTGTPSMTSAAVQQPVASQFGMGAPGMPPQTAAAAPASRNAAGASAPDPRQLPPGAMPLGFDGYCPVSMRNSNLTKWVPGNPQFGVQHRGRTYWFAGPQEKAQFWANPDMYAPALSGLDPVMFIDHRQQVPGTRDHSVDFENTFYMFASEASLQQFQANPKKYEAGVREAMGIKPARTLR